MTRHIVSIFSDMYVLRPRQHTTPKEASMRSLPTCLAPPQGRAWFLVAFVYIIVAISFEGSTFGVVQAAEMGGNLPFDASRTLDGQTNNIFSKQIDYYDRLLEEKGRPGDIPEVFIVETEDENGLPINYSYRHFPVLFPLSITTPQGFRFKFAEAIDSTFSAVLAIMDFNRQDSIVEPLDGFDPKQACPNLKLTASLHDTRLLPQVAAKAVSKILRFNPTQQERFDKSTLPSDESEYSPLFPTAIVGAALSTISETVAILAGVKSVPQVSSASTSTIFDNKGIFPTFGRVVSSHHGDARAAIFFLSQELNVTHLGVIFRRDAYGVDYVNALQQTASLLDTPMNITLTSYLPGDNGEKETAIQQLKDSELRYFFGVFYSTEYVELMELANKHNITGLGYYWMFGDGLGGLPGLGPILSPNSTVINASIGNTAISFMSPIDSVKYNDLHSKWTNGRVQPEFSPYFHSLKIEDDVQNPLNLDDSENLEYLTEKLTIGAVFMYDAVMAMALAACRSYRDYGPNFNGTQLYREFLKTSFKGLSGDVRLDQTTGSRDTRYLSYGVSTIRAAPANDGSGNFSFTLNRLYNSAAIEDDGKVSFEWMKVNESAPIIYSGNTTSPPYPLPPYEVKTIRISDWAQIFGLILSSLIILTSLFFSAWTAFHRKTKVVTASQPIFLHMLCAGTFAIGLAIVPLALQDEYDNNKETLLESSIMCTTVPWLVSGGFVIAFSAILSKLKRVNAVFGAKKHTKVVVETRDVLRPFTILFVLNVAVLTSWTVVDPLTYNMRFTSATDSFGRHIETYGRCINYDPSAEYLTFAVLWASIIIAVVVWANIEAYKARAIATEYSESQYLAISMALILQAILIGLPWLFAIQALPTFWFLVETSILFIVSASMLLPIFVPKMLHLTKWREEQSMRELRKSEKIQKWAEMKARLDDDEDGNLERIDDEEENLVYDGSNDDVIISNMTDRTRRMS